LGGAGLAGGAAAGSFENGVFDLLNGFSPADAAGIAGTDSARTANKASERTSGRVVGKADLLPELRSSEFCESAVGLGEADKPGAGCQGWRRLLGRHRQSREAVSYDKL
jgi:hypothetical protein